MSFAMNFRILPVRVSCFIQSRGYADKMKLTFAAANKLFYDNAKVYQVDVPSFSGSFGILAKHVPTLAVLRPGIVEVHETEGRAFKYFVSSGTIAVNKDSTVQVLAEEGHNIDDIDLVEARKLLDKYQLAYNTATTDMAKAEARIAIEACEALIDAAEELLFASH